MSKAGDPSAQWAHDPQATLRRTMTHTKYKAPAPCPAAGHCQTLDPQAEKGCGSKCPVWSGRECGPAWGWRACTGLSLPPREPQGHTRTQSSCHGVQLLQGWCRANLIKPNHNDFRGWLLSHLGANPPYPCSQGEDVLPPWGHPQPKAPSLGGRAVEQSCSSGEQRMGK